MKLSGRVFGSQILAVAVLACATSTAAHMWYTAKRYAPPPGAPTATAIFAWRASPNPLYWAQNDEVCSGRARKLAAWLALNEKPGEIPIEIAAGQRFYVQGIAEGGYPYRYTVHSMSSFVPEEGHTYRIWVDTDMRTRAQLMVVDDATGQRPATVVEYPYVKSCLYGGQ